MSNEQQQPLPPLTRVRTLKPAPLDGDIANWVEKYDAGPRLWGVLGLISIYSEKRGIYRVNLEAGGAGWFHPDEFEVLPQKLQPFFIELGDLDVIKSGDELHIVGVGYAGPHGGLNPGENSWWKGDKWTKAEAHSFDTQLGKLKTWWSSVTRARRMILPKLEHLDTPPDGE